METFAEVRQHLMTHHRLDTDEPFLLGFECAIDESDRKQGMFVAELEASDNRRYLRVETLVAPLEHFDAEKCLRINLMLRVGYLAVGDIDGRPYIKMCENLPYDSLDGQELEYVIKNIAPMADRMEQALESGGDIA
jgi:hypothetical protein